MRRPRFLLLVVLFSLPLTSLPALAQVKVGVFQVKEEKGTWSFVDPQGKRFFSIGINCINPKDSGKGKAYNGLSSHGSDQKKWEAATLKRLDDWNVNTIGGWSSLRGKPFVIEMSLSYRYADVFADEFEKYVEKRADNVLKEIGAKDYSALDNDPLLIGYFTDNELVWGWGYGWKDKEGSQSLFEYFATLKGTEPGKKAWASYLAATCNKDWDKLAEVWSVKVVRAEELLEVKTIVPRSPKQHPEAERVADGFLRKYAERYFTITDKAMRRRMPRHLNLGTRMTPGNPAAVVEVAAKYCDVLSFNMYERDLERIDAELTRLHKIGKKPVMLTEFAFPAKQNRTGNTNKGYERAVVKDDKERGEYYAGCADRLSKLPFVIGWHWFQYHDEPSEGRNDGENCNFGFVDVEDKVYEDLARQAKEANRRAVKARQ